MKKVKKVLHRIGQYILFALGFDCEIRRESVDEGLCDFSGQGRDKYGR